MRIASVRSGLAETFDDVSAVAIDANGTTLLSSGDVDSAFYYRSAIKGLQALAAIETGLDLPTEHLALACASHGGTPAHVAIVRQMLRDAGLDESALRTTPGRPRSKQADRALIAHGDRTSRPVLHNCSGKHAGWLAACVRAGWPTDTYLEPDHPLQQRIIEITTQRTGIDPTPTGIDGCGAPTLRGDVVGLANAFLAIETDEDLRPVKTAMARYGSLVSDNCDNDGRVGAMWGGPQKVGAEGCFGMSRAGVAIATKSWSGDSRNAVMAALHVADRIGLLTTAMRDALQPQLAPPVIGAGRPVGALEVAAW